MLTALRAECRKLLTVRSTYGISGFALLLAGFFSVYGVGYKSWVSSNPEYLQNGLLTVMGFSQLFVAVIAILIIAHEYRYNTIMYTLTISNSRLRVFLSKFIVIGAFSIVFALIALALAVIEMHIGVKLGGHAFGAQHVELYSLLWRSLVFMVSGAFIGLVFGFWSRSVVFAIVAFFIVPSLEPLLHLWLKVSNNALPFASLNRIVMPIGEPGGYSALASAGVFAVYLAIAWLVAVTLFLRRDAS